MIPHLLDQHALDAAMTWLRRSQAVQAPHYNLQDLAKLDDKLEAFVDGLRVAGEAGWERARDVMGSGEPDDFFPAALLAFESGKAERIQAVLDAVEKTPEALAGLTSALAWMPFEGVEGSLKQLQDSSSSLQRQAGLTAFVLHRHDPGPALQTALSDPDLALRACALRAVGELGRRDLMTQLHGSLNSEDAACSFWARWSAILLGDTFAAEGLKAFLVPGSPFNEHALGLYMRSVERAVALAVHKELAQNPTTLRLAVQAAGILGDPVLIPWIQEQFTQPTVARVSGEAFTMITGVDLAYNDLEAKAPEDFEAGPNDDPEDENVAMDPDEHLPWPHPQLIQAWWSKHQSLFPKGIRHLIGKPISEAHLLDVLRIGTQRQRIHAALEITLRRPGTPLFNTRVPGFRQLQNPDQLPIGNIPATSPKPEGWKTAMMRGIEWERARKEALSPETHKARAATQPMPKPVAKPSAEPIAAPLSDPTPSNTKQEGWKTAMMRGIEWEKARKEALSPEIHKARAATEPLPKLVAKPSTETVAAPLSDPATPTSKPEGWKTAMMRGIEWEKMQKEATKKR